MFRGNATSWRLDLFRKDWKRFKNIFSVADLKISGEDVMKELKLKPSKSWRDSEKLFQQVEDGKLKIEKFCLLLALKDLHGQDK